MDGKGVETDSRKMLEMASIEKIWDLLHDGFLVIGEDGNIRNMNSRTRELLGIPEGNELPLPLRRFSPELFVHLESCIGTESQQVFEATIAYPERRLLRVTCLPIDGKSPLLHALVLTDRTAEEERNAAFLEDEMCAAVQLLAGSMAHEMGNPLNTLQIQLQLLQRQLREGRRGKKVLEAVAVCRDEVDRLHRMVQQFLGAIRPAQPNLATVDLNGLMEGCIAVLREELDRHCIGIQLRFCRESPKILGDSEQLRRVFLNLLRNAMEAIDGTGNILVNTAEDNAFALVEIEDDGVGISPSALPHLLRSQHSNKRLGNGLGLLIVQRILRTHRGTIALRSLSPRGTRAVLRLPLENPRFPMLPTGNSENEIPDFSEAKMSTHSTSSGSRNCNQKCSNPR
ncbi:MAG: hypothetical protein LBS68_02350 [Puniceicoccales bacterium]|nr:hypothetical protein [Puniceicoccales bacterium]